jgi:hypothetical protein
VPELGLCDDGTVADCRRLPPVCFDGSVVAVVDACFICADVDTCAEVPEARPCETAAECIEGEVCETTSPPVCAPPPGCVPGDPCADTCGGVCVSSP